MLGFILSSNFKLGKLKTTIKKKVEREKTKKKKEKEI